MRGFKPHQARRPGSIIALAVCNTHSFNEMDQVTRVILEILFVNNGAKEDKTRDENANNNPS